MAVIVFFGTLALHTRHNDFPYSYHPDEGGKTGQIIGGSRNYHHPLLMLSVTDGISRVAFPIAAGLLIDRFGVGVPFWVAALLVVAALPLTRGLAAYVRPAPARPGAEPAVEPALAAADITAEIPVAVSRPSGA